MDKFYIKTKELIEDLKNKFENHHDYKIIAISLLNNDNINSWFLIDHHYLELFNGSQPSLQFGSSKLDALKYPALTRIVYSPLKKRRYIITPDKLKDIDNSIMRNLKLLAVRNRLANFGEVWTIHDSQLLELYEGQVTCLKLNGYFYHSVDYREEVYVVQHKISNEKYLMNYKAEKRNLTN